jgi:hypothetical protein
MIVDLEELSIGGIAIVAAKDTKRLVTIDNTLGLTNLQSLAVIILDAKLDH